MHQIQEQSIEHLRNKYGNELSENFKSLFKQLGYRNAKCITSLNISCLTDQRVNIFLQIGKKTLLHSYTWQEYLAKVQITQYCKN